MSFNKLVLIIMILKHYAKHITLQLYVTLWEDELLPRVKKHLRKFHLSALMRYNCTCLNKWVIIFISSICVSIYTLLLFKVGEIEIALAMCFLHKNKNCAPCHILHWINVLKHVHSAELFNRLIYYVK